MKPCEECLFLATLPSNIPVCHSYMLTEAELDKWLMTDWDEVNECRMFEASKKGGK